MPKDHTRLQAGTPLATPPAMTHQSIASITEPEIVELLAATHEAMRIRAMSSRTEKAYLHWIRRFIEFHRCHPDQLEASEVTAFLTHLAVKQSVAASTQNQALAAILFLYKHVLQRDLPWLENIVRAKKPKNLPVVLSRDEVAAILRELHGPSSLMGSLLYGSGLRLQECLRLRIKDVDLRRGVIYVRRGKGDIDRVTILPATLRAPLEAHIQKVFEQHQRDLRRNQGWVELPTAIERKYPNAGRQWPWQWLFPAARHYVHAPTSQHRRHHHHESTLQRTFAQAVQRARLTKKAGCHTLDWPASAALRGYPSDPGCATLDVCPPNFSLE